MSLMELDENPSPYSACGADCPISGITAFDMMEYANRLSVRDGFDACYTLENCAPTEGKNRVNCSRATFAGPDCSGYRLPSEAEWELVAGASADTIFPTGYCDVHGLENCGQNAEPTKFGWYCGNVQVDYAGCLADEVLGKCLGPHPVRLKAANSFGLYDMLGNVREVTGDLYTRDDMYVPSTDPGYSPSVKGLLDTESCSGMVAEDGLVAKGAFFYAGTFALVVRGRGALVGCAKNLRLGFDGFRLVRTAKK